MIPNPDITYFAKTDFRNGGRPVGMYQADRLLHTYVVGKTGTGKSSLLRAMFMQDVNQCRGACLLDPHGDLAEGIVRSIPEDRQEDLIYFDIKNPNMSLRYNPFKRVSPEKRSLVASGILDTLKKLWSDAWGVKLEHILRHAILTLLDQPSATIEDIPKLLLDRSFRHKAVEHVENESVRNFWRKEFPEYNRYDLLPVLNKVGGMLAHPAIRRVLIGNPVEVSLRKAMDGGKIIVVNLSKGHVGEDVAHILGALLVSSISSAAFSRADTVEPARTPFMLYLDEFHSFTTLSLVNMFSELRKFAVGMILAHQYVHQLEDDIRRAVFGNAGTLIAFRLGTDDAQVVAREMVPVPAEDFVGLANYRIYVKLMIRGVPSRPFSAATLRGEWE